MERRTHISLLIVGGGRSEENATRRKNSRLRCEEIPRRIKELGEEEEWNAKRLLDEARHSLAKAIPREYLYSRHLPAVNPWPAIKVGRQTGLVSSSLVCRASSLQPCNSRRSLTWTIIAHGAGYRAWCVRLSQSCSSLYDACPHGHSLVPLSSPQNVTALSFRIRVARGLAFVILDSKRASTETSFK